MASPRLLAICQPVARCLEQRDGAGLVKLLTPFADDPELDEAVAAVAAAFPHLRGRAVPTTWPASRDERCVAVLAASIARPRDDTALANAAVRPTSWNWLTSLRDVLAGRDPPVIGDLHAALEAMEVDQAAALLRALPWASARQGWQALLLTASLAGLAHNASVDQALQAVLADIARGEPDVPPPVVAVTLALMAQRRALPDDKVRARAAALPPGLSRDLATAAALTAWSEAGPLAADAIERLVLDPMASSIASRFGQSGAAWLDLLHQLLRTQSADWAGLFVGRSKIREPQEPNQQSAIRDAQMLARQAVGVKMPVTARMASLLLQRLRCGDSTERMAQPSVAGTTHLAAMIVPASVLRAIEAPLSGAERAARLVSVADAAVIGRRVNFSAPPLRLVRSDQITIAIVNFNQAQTTLRLLTSLERCWPDFSGDVALIDNGSEANDFDALTTGVARFWPGRVRLLRSEVNLGPGGARNILFDAARTPWVLSLDNDMIAIADFGRHLLPVVNTSSASFFNLAYEELDHPGLAGVGKSWSIVDDKSGGRAYHTGFTAWAVTETTSEATLIVSNRISGTAALHEVAAFRAVGGFAPETALCYEDYELSFRIADQGFVIENLSVPLFVHGHLAPGRVTDVSAVGGRFDRAGIAASTAAFSNIVATRFGAHLGDRAEARAPSRIVPRRFDLRHAGGTQFFRPLRPGAKTVCLLIDDAWASTASEVTTWLAARTVNIDLRDESEFAEIEQALLVLQAGNIIVAGPSILGVSVDRCRRLGLDWHGRTACPDVVVFDPKSTKSDRRSLYEGGPPVAIVAVGDELVAAIAARL